MPVEHFHYKHPLFGRGDWLNEPHKIKTTDRGIRWDYTPYYVWFACLLRSEAYKKYCKTKKGAFAKTYEQFGNVFLYENNFKGWFKDGDRGVKLFAEPFREIQPKIVRKGDAIDWDNPDLRIIQIDANRHKAYVQAWVRKLANEACKEVQKHKVISKAKIQFFSAPKDVDAYLRMLKVWDLKETGLKNTEIHKQCYPQNKRQIEIRLKEAQSRLNKKGADELLDAASAKLLLQKQCWQEVNRDYQKAKKLIENAAKGIFPKTT